MNLKNSHNMFDVAEPPLRVKPDVVNHISTEWQGTLFNSRHIDPLLPTEASIHEVTGYQPPTSNPFTFSHIW